MSLYTSQTAPAPPAPPAASPELDGVPGTGQRQRLLLIGGAALALVVVALVAYFLLSSGGGTPASTGPFHPTGGASVKPTAAANPAAVPLKTHSGNARNPFTPLVAQATTAPTGAGGTGSSSGTSGTSGTTTGTTTGTGTGTTGSTSGSTGTTTASAPLSSVPLVLTLKSVTGTSSASIWVYNKSTKKTAKYSPAIGSAFGKYFRLTGFLTDTKTGAKAALVEYGDTILTLYPGTSDTVQ